MFKELDIETMSSCNRFCQTCLRNSYPEKESVCARFEKRTYLSEENFISIIDQAAEMGFIGDVNIQFFNEPLLDPRIGDFGRYAKSKRQFRSIVFHSNGDLLNKWRAEKIDGAFDHINLALYDDNSVERQRKLQSLLTHTKINYVNPQHMVTHFSPLPNLEWLIEAFKPLPCRVDVQYRMIIDHTGKMLLCCDDIAGLWGLGDIHTSSLSDLWHSDKHMEIINTLIEPGGRLKYSYCSTCPRNAG